MKRAVVFGASGFVGSHLLRELLNSPDYGQVTVVVRRALKLTHPKLRTVIGDYNSLAEVRSEITAEEVFLALGTTQKDSPERADYHQVDHEYPVLAARFAKENGATSIFLISAVGASPKSRFFYVRTKGETERDVIALQFERTHIFRPSMILGNREERRSLLEDALMRSWSAFDPLLSWKGGRYKGITGQEIAGAMIQSAKTQTETLRMYEWKEMQDLLKG